MRITDTPFDNAFSRGKQELARQVIELEAHNAKLATALEDIESGRFTDGPDGNWKRRYEALQNIARQALQQSTEKP